MALRHPEFHATTLETLTGDDPRQLHRFYVMFRAVCRWQHEGLCREAALGHFQEASVCARRLKIACFSVGALALGHAYGRIESIADRWDGVELRASLVDIEPQLEHTLINLADLADELATCDALAHFPPNAAVAETVELPRGQPEAAPRGALG